jgi:hypothetical protein
MNAIVSIAFALKVGTGLAFITLGVLWIISAFV